MIYFKFLILVLLQVSGSFQQSPRWETFSEYLEFPIDDRHYITFNKVNNGLTTEIIKDDYSVVYYSLLHENIASTSVNFTVADKGVKFLSRDGRLDYSIEITVKENGFLIQVNWKSTQASRKQACFDLGESQWYGGPQQKRQYWPIQKLVLPEYSYIPKEADNAGITEPYWLSSDGSFIYVNKEVPLFVDQNNLMQNTVCMISEVKPPYSSRRSSNVLSFVLGSFPNPRIAHEEVIKTFFKKPLGYPDYRMTKWPIWSTWAEYKRDIDESIVMEFANKILQNNFKNGQIEIDDLWETCYGSLTVDENKFPNMTDMIDDLKSMGFRVTFWIHPFIDSSCQPYFNEALSKGYLVKNERNSTATSWWNSNGPTAAYVDFTNPDAANWWYLRLRTLQDTYGIDSFKFDAGETSWSPQIPVQTGNVNEQPSFITIDYVKTCARFGSMIEVRSGLRTQELPIYVRIIDKDSEWNFENGLPTLITTLLQMNMNGYLFVLPDMIGGNGYNGDPGKELFIRWLEANAFMPSLQFSYVPWRYDAETVNISRKFADLHEKYTYKVIEAFQKAVEKGAPVNSPIWWIDPTNEEAHKVWDEYLLGEDILVAPVIQAGAVSRDVYLPQGQWLAQGDANRILQGRQWHRSYPAPLDTLPFFIKKSP